MNDLHKALGDISNIRRQMARTTEFRGYGPVTLAATGCFAVFAACAQSVWIPVAALHRSVYLFIWVSTAVLSSGLIAAHTHTRAHRIHSGVADEMIRMAIEQFLPSVAAGALITVAVVRFVPDSLWMLPGLWQVVFSLGVFSSCRFLPQPIIWAGAWYLITGLTCIALAGERALSPWAMGIPFGAGQLFVAAILYVTSKESPDED